MRRLRTPTIVEPVAERWRRLPRWGRFAVTLALLAVAVVVPTQLDPYYQSVLFFPVGVYVLLAVGLNVVVGLTGLLDLGYVAFFAVGAYTTAKLTTEGTLTTWECVVVAIAIAMLAGVLLGAPTLRLRGDYLAIVTLGFGEIVRIIAVNTGALGEQRGIVGIPHPSGLFGVDFNVDPLPYYYLALAAIVLAVFFVTRLRNSRPGRAWTAVREDEDAAELMGVPTFTMKLWAFAVGASTGGLSGWIYATKAGFISPDNFPLLLSILILAAVVLGGLGSTPGVIAGAFAVAFIPEYLRTAPFGATLLRGLNTVVGSNADDITQYRVFLFGVALVLMMIFRPQGLLPSRQRAAELTEAEPAGSFEGPLGATVAPPDAGEGLVPGATATAVTAADAGDPTIPPAVTAGESAAAPEIGERVVLALDSVVMRFGGVVAMNDVSIEVREHEIFGIIGPNGAGKTTLFNTVTGVFRPTGGDVRVAGTSVLGRRPHQINRLGVARTFQNIRLFPNMTALENVIVGTDARHRTSVPGAIAGLPRHRREERTGRQRAEQLLEFMGIGHRADELARNLPYGDQRRLEIARAMATEPSVLLLDEPAAGFNPAEKRALIALLRAVRAQGYTIVLIEHDMGLVMNVCDRIAVLDFGEKIAEGLPADIQRNQRVIAAYLGTPSDAA